MINFGLRTLNTGEADADSLACWEISAFFLGSALAQDLEMDRDQATEWFINNVIEEAMRANYRIETQMAEDEMLESFTTSLFSLARARADLLGKHYPLSLDESGLLSRRVPSELSPVSISYLTLQFFRALKRGYIEIDGPDDKTISKSEQTFERQFRKIFEYIAGYAVAGRNSGTPHMTADCRSANRLHALLTGVCTSVGAGKVRPYSDWNIAQKAANDGGVDCLVHVGGPGMPGNAFLILVGATVQQATIEIKIIGQDKREFFKSFFSTKPSAFQAALVRPQDADPLTRLKCDDRDCLLYSYEEVWKGIAALANLGEEPISIKRVNAKVRKLLTEFQNVVFLHNFDKHNCVTM